MLSDLPSELLLAIADFLETNLDLYAFARTDHHIYSSLLQYRYRIDVARRGNATLEWAVPRRLLGTIQNTLHAGANINAGCGMALGALETASQFNYEELVRLFIGIDGIDVNQKREGIGHAALSRAIYNRNEGLVRLLLDTPGIDIEILDAWDRTPLMLAADFGMAGAVELLLDRGANVNARFAGSPALSYAADEGHEEAVRVLLAHGADVSARDRDGRTARETAACRGFGQIVELLDRHVPQPAAARDNEGSCTLPRTTSAGRRRMA